MGSRNWLTLSVLMFAGVALVGCGGGSQQKEKAWVAPAKSGPPTASFPISGQPTGATTGAPTNGAFQPTSGARPNTFNPPSGGGLAPGGGLSSGGGLPPGGLPSFPPMNGPGAMPPGGSPGGYSSAPPPGFGGGAPTPASPNFGGSFNPASPQPIPQPGGFPGRP